MPHRRLDRYLGTRGWILILCAAVWFLLGLGVLLSAARENDSSLLHLHLPAEIRVVGWWAGTILALYGAFAKKHLPLVTSALIIMPLIRVASYMWGWFTYLLPLPGLPSGYPNGWYSAAYHAVLIGLVLIAAHTKEPTRDGKK